MNTQRPVFIPKQYRIPRPMSVALPRAHPVWQIVPFEIAAALAAVLITLTGVLAGADRDLYSLALRAMSPTEPARSVVALTLTGRALRSGNCSADLRRTLSPHRPKALVLLPLAQELCAPEASPELGKVRALAPAVLHVDGNARPLGLSCPATTPCLADLGIAQAADWTSPANPASVPKLALEDLSSGR
ncbi:MAG TPA: hypothetical protein VER33_01855, partial [Polyangiaceae bacterium]|nr:hypothetical protein [Polyangiaceae bacterium]